MLAKPRVNHELAPHYPLACTCADRVLIAPHCPLACPCADRVLTTPCRPRRRANPSPQTRAIGVDDVRLFASLAYHINIPSLWTVWPVVVTQNWIKLMYVTRVICFKPFIFLAA